MDANAVNKDEILGQSRTCNAQLDGSGILKDTQSLLHELHGLAYNRFHLAALEAQRAGESLVAMLVMAVMVSALLIATWLGLMIAGVIKLVENGVMASSAMLIAIALNLLLALILCGMIRRRSHYLLFPATLRNFDHISSRRMDKKT
jgi:uncharacterized membrane protein YqjE